MKQQAALVGTQRTVELDAEGALDMVFALVVEPRYTADDLAFWFTQPLDQLAADKFRILREHGSSDCSTSRTAW
jgi:hypothetical protein